MIFIELSRGEAMIHCKESVRLTSGSCPAEPTKRPSKLICFLMGIFFLLVNCALLFAEDKSRFYSAQLLDDGGTILFTYAHTKTRQKSGGLIFGGSRTIYKKDIKIIGLYDLNSKTTKVLKKVKNEPGTNGGGNFTIRNTYGRKALLTRGLRYRGDEMLPGGRFLLDIDTTTLTQIPIEKEMAGLEMESWGSLKLAHSDGSLVVRAYSQGQKEGQNETVPLGHIWLRSENGQYILLTEYGRYRGAAGGELFFYDHSLRTVRAYRLQTGKNRNVSNREYVDIEFYDTRYGRPQQGRAVNVGSKGKELELSIKIDGSWQRKPFPIDMTPLR